MPLRVEREDGVAWLTLDRPPLNVLDTALSRELASTLRGLQRETELRLIALKGEGRVFSAGVDVGEHLGERLGPLLDAFLEACRALYASDVPTLAVIHGVALGGACELVALCDLALVADDAKLGTPEIGLGVVPPIGAALFPRLVGEQRAAALVLTGELLSGAEAARAGLAWRSVPAERLHAEAESVAAGFRSRSAAALRLAKRTLRDAARRADLDDAMVAATHLSHLGIPSLADAEEGLRAFLEKRQPRWAHR